MFGRFYALTKPGIVYGNLLTTLAAYLYGSRWDVHFAPFLGVLVGMAFVIASACVFNNYLDRRIDALMERTKTRALVVGSVSTTSVLLYSFCLGIVGFSLLLTFVNTLTALVALTGFLFYLLYDYTKRRTPAATLVGSVSGAVPILAGYTAAAGRIDAAGLILFLILVAWQMPHFYAIAIRRIDDYAAARIPVLPLVRGIGETKRAISYYIVLFLLAISVLTLTGNTGYVFLAFMLAIGLVWLFMSTRKDARTAFLMSLVVLLSFSFVLSVAPFLP